MPLQTQSLTDFAFALNTDGPIRTLLEIVWTFSSWQEIQHHLCDQWSPVKLTICSVLVSQHRKLTHKISLIFRFLSREQQDQMQYSVILRFSPLELSPHISHAPPFRRVSGEISTICHANSIITQTFQRPSDLSWMLHTFIYFLTHS